MSAWKAQAWAAIEYAEAGLPADASLDDRKAAVDAAYPFGDRAFHPYQVWLRCRREYLARFGYRSESRKIVESPMERMKRRAALSARPTTGEPT